jgi:hypothetical protein
MDVIVVDNSRLQCIYQWIARNERTGADVVGLCSYPVLSLYLMLSFRCFFSTDERFRLSLETTALAMG